jgi:flagellar assembly protein FliH
VSDFKEAFIHRLPDSQSKSTRPGELTKLVDVQALSQTHIATWQLSRFEDDDAAATELAATKLTAAEQEHQQQVKQQVVAQQKAELIKKEAYDSAFTEGYNAGFEQGSQEGLAAAKAEGLMAQAEALAPKVAQFDAVLALLSTPYAQLEQQTLDTLVAMALHIAQKVVEREIAQDTQWMVRALEQAIHTLPETEPDNQTVLQVQLHPEDFAIWQAQQTELSPNPHWHVSANTQLEPGSCLVKQGQSSVLNSWKTRFDEVVEDVVKGGLNGGVNSGAQLTDAVIP